MGVEHDRRVQDRHREERVLGHLEEHVHRPDRVASSATGSGRGRPPATRRAARRRGTARARGRGSAGFSSDASKSGEKWVPHITPANRTQATTGKLRTRIDPRVEDRQDHPVPDVRRRRPEEERDRRAERDQRRRDERQQQVLDHVDREQGRVVGVDARHGARPRSRRARRGTQTVRRRGTGLAGWARLTCRTSRSQTTAATSERERRRPARTTSRGAGSRADGGSAGTGPWAPRPRTRRARPRRRPARPDGRRGDRERGTGLPSASSSHEPARRGPRDRPAAAARRRHEPAMHDERSGYDWRVGHGRPPAGVRSPPGAACPLRVRRADRVRGPSMSTTPGSRPSSPRSSAGWSPPSSRSASSSSWS